LQQKSAEMTAKWQAERTSSPARAPEGAARPGARRARQAKREGNLAKAGELSYGVIPQLEKQLAEAEEEE
jgi:ATP-dependent Clp protease ATP-binding subunit ClpB